MNKSNFVKWFPIIVGVFLGIASVIVGRVPHLIAQWTGLTVIANSVGYLLCSLIIAYINRKKWIRSFLTSSLTIIIATIVYYSLIEILMRLSLIYQVHGLFSKDVVLWSFIGIGCGVIYATAFWLVTRIKSRLICFGLFGIGYIGMLGVIYYTIALFYINVYRNQDLINSGYIARRSFPADMFEIVFAVVLTTIIWIVIFTKYKHDNWHVAL